MATGLIVRAALCGYGFRAPSLRSGAAMTKTSELGRQRNVRTLESVPAKGPTADEVVARARAMIPVLAARSRAARRGRRIADETVAEMQQAGLFRVLQPKRWGGYEMDLHTFYEVQFALAQGDMSSAWIYGVSGVHPWFMALLEDKAAQEVWGSDPSTLICSWLMPAGKAVAVSGGYRLAGRWKYASGVLPLRMGLARRPGCRRRRRSPRGTHLFAAARAIRGHRYVGGLRAAGRPAAGTSWSTT